MRASLLTIGVVSIVGCRAPATPRASDRADRLPIEVAIETIERAPFLTEEQKRDIFNNNAARFLRLTEAAVLTHLGR